MRREGETVELLGYRFANESAVALRALTFRDGKSVSPSELVFKPLTLEQPGQGRLPSLTGGVDVRFTDIRHLGGEDQDPFLHRCMIIYLLSRYGWNKVVPILDTPARREAVAELISQGLVQEVENLRVTSTRALRFSQFGGLEIGRVRTDRIQRATSAYSRIAPAFVVRR